MLSLCGLVLMGIGAYFAFARPNLLPEDVRYVGPALLRIENSTPGLGSWLHLVFEAMGGYIFTSGLLTLFLAMTSFRARARGAALVATLAGATSVGVMTAVNFALVSDFRWWLLGFSALWALALARYATGK
jgi:hypothetical protein